MGEALLQRQMCPATVVVGKIISKNTVQVICANDDHVVDAVSAQGSDQPFHVRTLPG